MANYWSFGVSNNRGMGLGADEYFSAANSGTLSTELGLPTDPRDATKAAAGLMYFETPEDPSTAINGPSDSMRRPHTGWPACA